MSLTSSSSTLDTDMAATVAAVAQVIADVTSAFSGASSNKRGGLGDLRIEIAAAQADLAVAHQRTARIAQMAAALDAAS